MWGQKRGRGWGGAPPAQGGAVPELAPLAAAGQCDSGDTAVLRTGCKGGRPLPAVWDAAHEGAAKGTASHTRAAAPAISLPPSCLGEGSQGPCRAPPSSPRESPDGQEGRARHCSLRRALPKAQPFILPSSRSLLCCQPSILHGGSLHGVVVLQQGCLRLLPARGPVQRCLRVPGPAAGGGEGEPPVPTALPVLTPVWAPRAQGGDVDASLHILLLRDDQQGLARAWRELQKHGALWGSCCYGVAWGGAHSSATRVPVRLQAVWCPGGCPIPMCWVGKPWYRGCEVQRALC